MALAELTFFHVFWLLILASLWLIVAAFIVIVLVDNFRRTDHSGWAKAGWTLLVIMVPLLGAIVYQIVRPSSLMAEKEWDSAQLERSRDEAFRMRR
jgi:hypothetical protein